MSDPAASARPDHEPPLPASAPAEAPTPTHPYEERDDGIFRRKETRDGVVADRLTTFRARIVEEVVHDDGVEWRLSFLLRVEVAGRSVERLIPASKFASLDWVAEFGAQAVLAAGHGTRDHARAAIQCLSGEVTRRTVFSHLGWHEIEGRWCFLHAGGAVSADGLLPEVSVEPPPALQRYRLPAPPEGDALRAALRSSLALLDLGAHGVGVVILATAFRAPLGSSDFSVHLTGSTGVFKTEAAALAAQHYGPELTARQLPASWTSTANSNEALAFFCKDALLVVDDFAPSGSATDVQRLHAQADRLLRSQGNASGRGRLAADGSLRAVRQPRGLILSTGEETPAGQSLRARLFTVEVEPGDIDVAQLTRAQACAAGGEYAAAMSGFLRWLAADRDRVFGKFRSRVAVLRGELSARAAHRRTAGIAAELIAAVEILLEFAQESGALDAEEAEVLRARVVVVFEDLMDRQAHHLRAAEPAGCFAERLVSAVSSGAAHLCDRDGRAPPAPGTFGWRERPGSDGGDASWEPRGRCAGWIDGDELYLDPHAAFAAVQDLGKAMQEPLAISARTLNKRLSEKGLLASTDKSSKTLTVRRILAGAQRRVLHLRLESLFPCESGPPRQVESDHGFLCPTCQGVLDDELQCTSGCGTRSAVP